MRESNMMGTKKGEWGRDDRGDEYDGGEGIIERDDGEEERNIRAERSTTCRIRCNQECDWGCRQLLPLP